MIKKKENYSLLFIILFLTGSIIIYIKQYQKINLNGFFETFNESKSPPSSIPTQPPSSIPTQSPSFIPTQPPSSIITQPRVDIIKKPIPSAPPDEPIGLISTKLSNAVFEKILSKPQSLTIDTTKMFDNFRETFKPLYATQPIDTTTINLPLHDLQTLSTSMTTFKIIHNQILNYDPMNQMATPLKSNISKLIVGLNSKMSIIKTEVRKLIYELLIMYFIFCVTDIYKSTNVAYKTFFKLLIERSFKSDDHLSILELVLILMDPNNQNNATMPNTIAINYDILTRSFPIIYLKMIDYLLEKLGFVLNPKLQNILNGLKKRHQYLYSRNLKQTLMKHSRINILEVYKTMPSSLPMSQYDFLNNQNEIFITTDSYLANIHNNYEGISLTDNNFKPFNNLFTPKSQTTEIINGTFTPMTSKMNYYFIPQEDEYYIRRSFINESQFTITQFFGFSQHGMFAQITGIPNNSFVGIMMTNNVIDDILMPRYTSSSHSILKVGTQQLSYTQPDSTLFIEYKFKDPDSTTKVININDTTLTIRNGLNLVKHILHSPLYIAIIDYVRKKILINPITSKSINYINTPGYLHIKSIHGAKIESTRITLNTPITSSTTFILSL